MVPMVTEVRRMVLTTRRLLLVVVCPRRVLNRDCAYFAIGDLLTCSSAAAILSLLEEGTFDYGSIFTDQAPLQDFDFSPGMVQD